MNDYEICLNSEYVNVLKSFYNSILRPFQDYFSSYETGQSVGGAKTGEPREKPPGTPIIYVLILSKLI